MNTMQPSELWLVFCMWAQQSLSQKILANCHHSGARPALQTPFHCGSLAMSSSALFGQFSCSLVGLAGLCVGTTEFSCSMVVAHCEAPGVECDKILICQIVLHAMLHLQCVGTVFQWARTHLIAAHTHISWHTQQWWWWPHSHCPDEEHFLSFVLWIFPDWFV